MKKSILLLFLIVLLNACNSEGGTSAAGAVSTGDTETEVVECVGGGTRDIRSMWNEPDFGITLTLNFANDFIFSFVVVDDGICNDLDGDGWLSINDTTGKITVYNCDYSVEQTYDYEVDCNNDLQLTNSSIGGPDLTWYEL